MLKKNQETEVALPEVLDVMQLLLVMLKMEAKQELDYQVDPENQFWVLAELQSVSLPQEEELKNPS